MMMTHGLERMEEREPHDGDGEESYGLKVKPDEDDSQF